ncbi:MAG: hypothetical protein BWY49_00615 [Candidatus Omnitrophica bacterium ADurb.Bin314]|nr:MAG: hypothetical protein BWY49_00615 [Candidatus Omnitrophica bacterium ADurb.Bin314]
MRGRGDAAEFHVGVLLGGSANPVFLRLTNKVGARVADGIQITAQPAVQHFEDTPAESHFIGRRDSRGCRGNAGKRIVKRHIRVIFVEYRLAEFEELRLAAVDLIIILFFRLGLFDPGIHDRAAHRGNEIGNIRRPFFSGLGGFDDRITGGIELPAKGR